MTTPKNQHYVPKFYLRRFCDVAEQVHVFDKASGASFLTNVQNIAAENHFYDFPDGIDEIPDRQVGEKFLSSLEDDFADAVSELVDGIPIKARRLDLRKKWIHKRLREPLALFLAIQAARTKEAREQFLEMAEKTMRFLVEERAAAEYPEMDLTGIRVRMNEQVLPSHHMGFFLSPEYVNRMVPILTRHYWMLGINRTGVPMYTSDNPVVRRPHIEDPGMSHIGLGSPGIEVAIPLSPWVVLILFDRGLFPDDRIDGRAIDMQSENVEYYNSLQVLRSYRQVFSIDGDFTQASAMRESNPEISRLDRPRIQVIAGGKEIVN